MFVIPQRNQGICFSHLRIIRDTLTAVPHPTLTPALLLATPSTSNHLLGLLISFGLLGIFLVSIVDSSFVPLPIPGVTDILCVFFAARHTNPFLLIAVSTLGSALGGWFSYQVGQSGGMAFIEKRTPPRLFKRVSTWMESHAVLAVALPALLPPPMPLSVFVLAAGALKMSRPKFLWTFTLSRLLRHAFAVWLGIRYGRNVLRVWNRFSATWGTTILIVLWTGIALSLAYAFWKLYQTRKQLHA